MHNDDFPPSRAATASLWLLAIMLAVRVTMGAWQIGVPSDRLPHVDAAGHGIHGVKMAHAIARLDVPRFIELIDERDEWPPLWAMAEAPVFLIFGDDYSVGRGFVAVLQGLGVLALFAVGFALPGRRGLLAGAAAAAFYAMSPFSQLMATIVMLEVPAIMLLAVALAFYVRYCRFDKPIDATMTAVFTTVLFFHKFGYGTLWMASVALNELGRGIPMPRRLLTDGIPLLARKVLWFTVLPIVAWFAVPGHLRAFLGYMGGIETPEHTLLEHVFFYPNVFMRDYSDPFWVGTVVLLGAALSVLWIPRLQRSERILPISMAATMLIATSHGFKGLRHMFTIAPLIWLCFGWTLGLTIDRLRAPHRWSGAYAAAMLLLVVALWKGVPQDRVLHIRSIWSGAPQTVEVLEDIAEIHMASRGTALTGVWWDLSNQLVEWHLLLTKRVEDSGVTLPGSRPVNPHWYGVGAGAAAVPRLAADSAVERVMVLELPPGGPEYEATYDRENPELLDFKAAMDASPAFLFEETREYPATGYLLHVYAKAASNSAP